MQYVSTRGQAPARAFDDVLLAGLAEDGGLFVPEAWPVFSPDEWRAHRALPYADLAAHILSRFTAPSIDEATLKVICREAYAGFRHAAVVPLVQLDTALFTQELFHGPTFAFKDLALQVVGRLFDLVLERRNARITIIGATSGDTGSAAIAACAGRARVDVAILHPHNRTSEVQRRQMTTVNAANVANFAIDGTFDVCQDMVKAMFGDGALRRDLHLAAVNSINWARIAAQIPYHAAACLALGAPDREVTLSVPTGNFGNVLAAWAAKQMGLPVRRFVVASNHNDILARFLESNDMSVQGVTQSLSPSMDIQVSSNFERLLYALLGNDPEATSATMAAFRATGKMPVAEAAWRRAREEFHGFRLSDKGTLAEIAALYAATGYLADPHTAIGVAAARHYAEPGIPSVAAGTAHPAKFPDAIRAAIGSAPPPPEALAAQEHLEERYQVLPNDTGEVIAALRRFAGRNR
jgi:threonine synthase